jgi:hypothetical protein
MIGELRSTNHLIVEVATKGDAAWFDKNADRRIRLRKAVAMEFSEDVGRAPVGMEWFAIVLEAQPGARMRQPVALPIGFDVGDMDDSALFSLFQQAAPQDAKDLLGKLRAAKLPGTAKRAG